VAVYTHLGAEDLAQERRRGAVQHHLHLLEHRLDGLGILALDRVDAGPKHWLTLARTVAGSGASGDADFAVLLGVEAGLAGDLAAARGISLDERRAQEIGMGCARCFRQDCRQRSLPPRGAPLQMDRIMRGITPFEFKPINK